MSDEDTLAREDSMKFVDSHQPLALEVQNAISPPDPKSPEPRCDAHPKYTGKSKPRTECPSCLIIWQGTLDERERKAAERAAERERAKAQRVLERAQLKLDEKAAKIAEAEGGIVQLPAVVLRDGTVRHVPDQDAWAVMEMYLDDMGLDCETSGYPLGHQLYECRTVQLGGEEAAIVYDASDPAQMQIASLALKLARRVRAHSATADVIPVVVLGLIDWDEMWAKMHDSVLNAKLTDPKMSGSDADALKELARDLLREYAVSPNAEIAKNALFKAMGCLVDTTLTTPIERNGWYQVNRYSVVMTRYAGSDVLDLMACIRVLPPLPVSEAVMDREREFQAACAPVTYTGFKLDSPHIKNKIKEEEAAKAEAQQAVVILSDGKITNPKSPDVIKILPELIPGLVLPIHRKSKRPTADSQALEKLARQYDAEAFPVQHHLFKQILDYRHRDTTLTLLLRPLEQLCDHGDGRMRPTVYTIEASTGRCSCRRPNGQQLCYDSVTEILTDKGWKAFPEIDGSERVAQWAAGLIEFVKPAHVTHEAYDGPMIKISGEHHEQVVTPNHRVYSTTRDGKLMIEAAESWLKHGAVDKIVDRKFIRGGRLTGRKLNDDERLSLYQAVAVQADGHLLSYETNCIRLQWTKARKIRRARELGFDVRAQGWQAGGKDVYGAWCGRGGLEHWVDFGTKTFNIPALLELDSSELELFLAEVMFWDGDSTRKAGFRQHEERAATVDAVEMAAFLSGNSTCRSVYELNGRRYPNVQVFPKAERHASRTNVEEVPSDGMIHCVTVPSGAIVVRRGGKVIVSGNSRQGGIRACVVCDPGYLGISADFQGCEIRVGAGLSGDKGLYEAEISPFCYKCQRDAFLGDECSCGLKSDGTLAAHQGLHWRTAHGAHSKAATKEHRYQAKRGCVPEEGSEILTRRGWLTHAQVRAGDETPALQPDGSMAWTKVLLVAHYPDAPLTRLSVGKNWSAVVTPDHRWATRKRRDGGSRGRYFENGITHAHELTAEHVIRLSGAGHEGPGLPISDAEAALIAWVYTDGSIEQSELTGRTAQGADGRRRKFRASITQAKPAGIAALEKVLAEASADFSVKTEQNPLGDHCLPLNRYRLRTEFARDVWTRAGLIAVADKAKPGFSMQKLVLALSASQRRAFLQAVEDAEGWRDRHGTLNIGQNAGPVLEAIELAGYLEGFYVKRYKHRVYKGNQHWKVTFTRPRVGCTRLKREDAGRGDVWCVQTETGTWTMRQDGGPAMITGNTFTRLFGGGPGTAADQVGCSVPEMQKIFDAFNDQAPAFTAWDNNMRQWYQEGSFVWKDYTTGETNAVPIEGGNRMIYQAYSGRNIYIDNGQHAAGNGAIQGTARELLVDGTLLWKRGRWGHYAILPIHDELICFVPAQEATLAVEKLKRCMETRVLSSPGFEVLIGADSDRPWKSWPDAA